jgi:pimeloyl-ACP methyl ester carboxylesterase
VELSAEGRARVGVVTGGHQPSTMRVPAGPLALSCLRWGVAADPTAVLVHGNGAHAHWWDALVPWLLPGWHLVAPDLRGHGESDWAEPPRYRLEDFAADLLAVLDALGAGPVVLVGHSMGGRVTAWLAARHPERVRALALLDTRLERVSKRDAASWRAQVAGKRRGRGYPSRAAALAAFRFVPDEADVPAAVVDDLAHHAIVERAPGDWTFRFDRAVLALDGDGGGDLHAALRRVRCPTLILAGETSWVMDAPQRAAVAAAIPGATVRVFPGGHHFFLRQAPAVGPVLRAFLDATP